MLNSLVCRIFHKKEVHVIDIADALLLVVFSAIVLGCGTRILYNLYLFVEGDLPSFMFGIIFMLVGAVATTVVAYLLSLIFVGVLKYFCKHLHDVVAVCPKYAKETKEE